MIWKENDFNTGILKIKAILLYGSDAGLVDEYCEKTIEKLEVEKDNLFAIDAKELKDKQDAVFAESFSQSMFGGKKVVIISLAGDAEANIISDLVNSESLCSTVIVTAGELRAGGSLRNLFEKSENIAALACYTDNAKMLESLIRQELSAASGIKQVTPDAMDYMLSHFGEDRGVTRSFLKKIAIYVSDKHVVDLSDVEKCLPDTSASSADDYMYSLSAGHIEKTMVSLDRLLYSGADATMLIRMLDGHFKKLLVAVVDGQLPKLFWTVKDRFCLAIKIWSEQEITNVLSRLSELEKQIRTKGMSPEILIRDFSLKLVLHAYKLSIKRRK
ncbi:MAG: DNA polymerase III subunit delta [Alphaproteobacteria bacterium]|nr:DNA polymerase III subunit delta [Alphaproteobacteria bacterium]